jgi:hypothetical protein
MYILRQIVYYLNRGTPLKKFYTCQIDIFLLAVDLLHTVKVPSCCDAENKI